jgi:DNA uptake protein ComE-like DNA-binding protein
MKPEQQKTINELRNEGHLVIVWTPQELDGIDPSHIEDALIERGNDMIEQLQTATDESRSNGPHQTTAGQAMTSNEYIEQGGTVCPFCKSQDIEGQEVNINAGSAWQEVSCNQCSQEWQDIYTLNGYASTNK